MAGPPARTLRHPAAPTAAALAGSGGAGDFAIMTGRIAALYRHPVKGFTPERLPEVMLEAGAAFPCDRLFAVENGPSGFDPERPAFLPKRLFTVLASIPALARARTSFDEATGLLTAAAEGHAPLATNLGSEGGRAALARWLEGFIDAEDRNGPLRVIEGPGAHRFMDDRMGAVSLVNLSSVQDLAAKVDRPIDPLRFRANIYVDGWPVWAEMDLAPGAVVRLGEVEARVVKPIVRCAATHVDPATGARDLEIAPALHAHYGHICCGLYLQVAWGGRVAQGDAAPLDLTPPQAPSEATRPSLRA